MPKTYFPKVTQFSGFCNESDSYTVPSRNSKALVGKILYFGSLHKYGVNTSEFVLCLQFLLAYVGYV